MVTSKGSSGLRAAAYGDIHGRYFSLPATKLAAKIISNFKPDVTVNLGDGADIEAISRFGKSLEQLAGLQDDIDAFIRAQDILLEAAPDAKKYFCIGNHDERIAKLCDDVTGLSTLKALTLPELYGLNDRGIKLVDSIVVGKDVAAVEFVHGFYIRKPPGGSIAAMMEGRGFTHSMIMGHSHRVALIQKTTAAGVIYGVEAGWLGSSKGMRYMQGKTSNWANAIVLVTFGGKPLRAAFEILPIYVTGDKAFTIWRGKNYEA